MYECHPSEKLKRNVKTWIGIFSSDIYVILSDQNRFNAQYWCKNHSISFIILFFWFSNSKISWKYAPIDHSARQSSGFLSGHCSSDRQPQPMVIAMLLLWNPICVSSIMNYGQIFVSMAVLLKQEKRLLLRALAGGFAFAAVSILYSTIALLLN